MRVADGESDRADAGGQRPGEDRDAGSARGLGEGLHQSYANRTEFRGDINTARLELFCILQDEKALKLVQQACEREFEKLWAKTAGGGA